MASINQVPEVLNDFRVYEEGSDNCLGVAKVELPSESVMTQTVKGVGIAGEVEAPVIGHYSSMETKLTWNTPTVLEIYRITLLSNPKLNLRLKSNSGYHQV